MVPQLRAPGGDVWGNKAAEVQEIVKQVQSNEQGDPKRTYLTGFSYGSNGVFDIGLKQPDFWAALWAVEPTRPPDRNSNPNRPVWLSGGPYSRRHLVDYIQFFQPLADNLNDDFLYLDRGLTDTNRKPGADTAHVKTATLAYQDDRVYDWLLTKHLL